MNYNKFYFIFALMIISKEWMKSLRFSLKLIEDAPLEFGDMRYVKFTTSWLIQASDWFIFSEFKRCEELEKTQKMLFKLTEETETKSILVPRSKIYWLKEISSMEIKKFVNQDGVEVYFLYIFERNDSYTIIDDFIWWPVADTINIWYNELKNKIFSGERSLFGDWKPQLMVSQVKIRFDKAIGEVDKRWFYDIWEKYILSEGTVDSKPSLSYKFIMTTQKKFE